MGCSVGYGGLITDGLLYVCVWVTESGIEDVVS